MRWNRQLTGIVGAAVPPSVHTSGSKLDAANPRHGDFSAKWINKRRAVPMDQAGTIDKFLLQSEHRTEGTRMVQRILLIGATGLLGEPVARGLEDAGFSVRVMSRNISRARAKFSEPFEIVEGDALMRADVEEVLTGCDAVHISIDHDREDE